MSRIRHAVLLSHALLVFSLLALAPGCSSDAGGGPPRSILADGPAFVVATLAVSGGDLVLLDLREPSPAALPPRNVRDPRLTWRFEDAAGGVAAEGTLTDPLLVRTEFDEHGAPAPADAYAKTAVFEVTLPNVGGTFVLIPPGASGGTAPQSLGGVGKLLSIVIEKLVGIFEFKPLQHIQAGPTEQIVKPACTGFSILIVGDGYTLDERGKFDADVAKIVDSMSQNPVYAKNWKHISIWRRFFASRDSGISDPANGVERDTAFGVAHDANVHRCISMGWLGWGASWDALWKLVLARGESRADVTLVLANTTEHAGCAQPSQRIAYGATHPMMGETMTHELGHALFDLSDEYELGTCNPGTSHVGPNVALDLGAIPWAERLTPGVQLPTIGGDASTVGAYEGALYCTSGVYRPQQNCIMRSLDVDFCAVCAAHVDARFAERTRKCPPTEPCGHGECQTGGALSKVCGGCAWAVCAERPSCCEPGGTWDVECVQITQNRPGVCHAVCADGQSSCSHDECTAGAALTDTCSACAASVCKKDSLCCSAHWSESCAMKAKTDPFCACLQ